MIRTGRRRQWLVLVPAVMLACSDPSAPPPAPGSLQLSGAVAATAVVGTTVSPAVRVLDTKGEPMSGVPVTFEVTGGGGSVSAASVATDANGVATLSSWTLGTTAGANTLTARHGTLTAVHFTVNTTAGPPASITLLTSNVTSGTAGQPLPLSPGVLVRDQYANAVAGVQVTFTAGANSGTITGGVATSDAGGAARPGSWTLGPNAGAQTMNAVLGALSAVITVNAVTVTMQKLMGDNTHCPINTNDCRFAVTVRNAQGAGVPGEVVVWTGPGGATANTTTNLRGHALTPNIGTTASLGGATMTAQLQSTGQSLSFAYTFVQWPANAAGQYNIDIRFVGSVSASQQAAFMQAKQRWERVITGNLSSVSVERPAASICGGVVQHPAINETVDDLLVFVQIDSIDGPGGTLGTAGPCLIRATGVRSPVVGVMRFDVADFQNLENAGVLGDVVRHELGHVIGMPFLWGEFGQLTGACGTPPAGCNPYYTGARGASGFQLSAGTLINGVGVPVENTGGEGTHNSHWRESVLSNELMTGYINTGGGVNPLSVITIGAMMDGGYQVNFGAADTYMLPGTSLRAAEDDTRKLRLIELPLPAPQAVF